MAEFDDSVGVACTTCPYCGEVLDAARSTAGDAVRPSDGDPTLCAYCAGLLVFNADGSLRFPTDAELMELHRDPEIDRARQALLAWIAAQGAGQ